MAHSRTFHLGRADSALSFNNGHIDHIPISEEDLVGEMDEPPEQGLTFGRKNVMTSPAHAKGPALKETATRMCRSPSLLTQGLLTSPDLHPTSLDTTMARAHSTASNGSMISTVSTAELTSDGGLTSPARTNSPSPPLPSTMHTGLALVPSKTLEALDNEDSRHIVKTEVKSPEPTPLRKRCITFACPGPRKQTSPVEPKSKEEPAPRKTCLKFACPSKPSREAEEKAPAQAARRPLSPAPSKMQGRRHRDSSSTVKDAKAEKAATPTADTSVETPKPSKKSKNPDGLRFHEFAAPSMEEEAWITAAPTSRHKITVTDTLRKENAIRKLGEEAEEEALEEEEEEDEEDFENELDSDEDAEDEDDDDDEFDSDESDGNETDNEEGFADSDEESDDGSDYQFWTPATTTAATSVELLEHIRPRHRRSNSESSIESAINTNGVPIAPPTQPAKRAGHHRSSKRGRQQSPHLRPGTPELPDSTDFVCGTFDEDRPLEAAYLACMEQRRIAKEGIIPQDVDPSFPTSDPEQGDDDDDDVGDEEDDDVNESDVWINGKPEDIDETPARGRGRSNSTRQPPQPSPNPSPAKRAKSPAPVAMRSKSPALQTCKQRAKSPCPLRRAKSPCPPRRLFNRSPHRHIPPTPASRHLPSPPSSRRCSVGEENADNFRPGRLAQRPNLTRTKSLPRTPNPFFSQQGRRGSHRPGKLSRVATGESDISDAVTSGQLTTANQTADEGDHEPHSRGPIDIVQGLEHKRMRRKEKFWRLHCRKDAKAKVGRTCAKGKGAERMRDVGLEMSERARGYGPRAPLVLSV